ncbi:MAG: hypothetical protein QM756_44640 [Polyangiaceae bacterium]
MDPEAPAVCARLVELLSRDARLRQVLPEELCQLVADDGPAVLVHEQQGARLCLAVGHPRAQGSHHAVVERPGPRVVGLVLVERDGPALEVHVHADP